MTVSSPPVRQIDGVPARQRSARRRTLPIGGAPLLGLGLLAAIVVMSFLAPILAGKGPDVLVTAPLQPPSAHDWFGTDGLGRDVFVRSFVAARTDYLIAAIGVGLSLLIGTTLGILAASSKRQFWDRLLMRTTDAMISIPFPLLVLVIVLSVGQQQQIIGLPLGAPPMLAAILLVGWAVYARLARTATRTLMSQEFIAAARLMGSSRLRIVCRHLLPNVISTTGTYAISDSILVIGLIGGLAFLGAGIVAPTPEWGAMIYGARSVLASAWWISAFPILLVVLTGIAISLIANGLFDRQESRR
jgi:peptide/nickel transport system permease protein